MRSIKAVFAGLFFIVVFTLVLQLVFLFLAVGYNALVVDYPFLDGIQGYFRYLVGMPVAMVIMFFGGYVTASVAGSKPLVYSAVTGLLALALAIVPVLENFVLTPEGAVTLAAALLITMAGGWFWRKRHPV